jgi:RNA polymerase sigma factor (sigma-70 family)
MSQSQSVTAWIHELRGGDAQAAQKLWEGYFARLVRLAQTKLRGLPRGGADEEDVALSAFDSFCRGAQLGRFPRLDDRDDLWQILFFITERKAIDLIQHETRAKRDVRRTQHDPSSEAARLADRVNPDPAFAAEVAETFNCLLAKLGDETLRTIALRKLDGYTNQEIATELKCSLVTIERRLRLIRREWQPNAEGKA